MKTNTTKVQNVPIVLTVDDRKLNLTITTATLERRLDGATFQITGKAEDLSQIADLAAYLQSIPLDP